jgi:hypothetical protein
LNEFNAGKDRLHDLLKAWAAEYTPPPSSRTRLMRVARHLSAPDSSQPHPVVNFQPFVRSDWSQFGFGWDSTQLFKSGLNWTSFKA